MQIAFSDRFTYDRFGLLAGDASRWASTWRRRPSTRRRSPAGCRAQAAARWIGCAIGFLIWCLLPTLEPARRIELGFLGAAAALFVSLLWLYRRAASGAASELDSESSSSRRSWRLADEALLNADRYGRCLSDYELILVAGLLLAAGLAGGQGRRPRPRARSAAVPRARDAARLGGARRDRRSTTYELARTLGTIGLILILFEGGLTAGWGEIRPVLGTAISLATIGTVVTARDHRASSPSGSSTCRPSRACSSARAVAATDSAAIFAVLRGSHLRKPPGPRARGRVRDERSGRAAARHRVHRLDPGPGLRRRRHGGTLAGKLAHRRRRRESRSATAPAGAFATSTSRTPASIPSPRSPPWRSPTASPSSCTGRAFSRSTSPR